MTTAIDTSVLISIYKGEREGGSWLDLLSIQRTQGRLIVCEVVVAEFQALSRDRRETTHFFKDLGAEYEAMSPTAALLSGEIFHGYRKSGGPRERLIPDFLVGAHALVQADHIAAADRGYLRRYFPKLKVVVPKGGS